MSQTTPDDAEGLDALVRVTNVVDGDTWDGVIRPFPRLTLGADKPLRFRLLGADTHETDADDDDLRERAETEAAFTRDWIKEGRESFDGDWPFRATFEDAAAEGRGAFGRVLADLRRRSDGASLADTLKQEFDGVEWEG